MTIDFKHNPEEFKRQFAVAWNVAFTKRIEGQVVWGLIGCLFIFMSYVNTNEKSRVDDCLFAIGMFLFIVVLNYLNVVRKTKKKFDTLVTDRSKVLEGTEIHFEFREESLYYRDIEITYNFPWSSYGEIKFSKGVLLIKLKNSDSYHLTLSENVISREKMKEVISFLNAKIGK
jgi:hypothetical protein